MKMWTVCDVGDCDIEVRGYGQSAAFVDIVFTPQDGLEDVAQVRLVVRDADEVAVLAAALDDARAWFTEREGRYGVTTS